MSQSKVKQQRKQEKKREQEQIAAQKKKQRVRWMMIGTLVALIIIVGGIGIYFHHAKSVQQAQRVHFDYKKYPVMGNPNAPVKMVEFGDYRCPYCKNFDQTVFPSIKKNYIDKGKVAYYFVNVSMLGPGSVRAALAAEYVYFHKPNDFWKYHEALYAHQGSEKTQWATPQYLTMLAVETIPKIQAGKMLHAINQQTYIKEVNQQKQEAAKVGITRTPTIYIDGMKMSKVDYTDLKKAIDQELAQKSGKK